LGLNALIQIKDLGIKFPKVIQDDVPNGRAYYDIENPENRYPSVTTILSKTQSEEFSQVLSDWKNRVGEEQANRIFRRGRNRGSAAHQLIEDYFCKGEPADSNVVMPHVLAAYSSIKLGLESIADSICLFEQPLLSNKLKVAGRVDCIAFLKDLSLSIVDFKTSRRHKKIDDCEDYLIQTTLYGIMLNELLEQQGNQNRVTSLSIIMSIDDDPRPFIIIEPFSKWESAAIERVNQYYRLGEENERNV
jgi:genome maintenance exonuclease 1